jgi:benzoyl-CoA reductase/2-hydroxyglutaryl-CoA dehydratase subunit BcrC/BadD/HgdB
MDIHPFTAALERKTGHFRSLASGGVKIIGYFCTYTPVELIHAAGCVPLRITGGASAVEMADPLAPGFICPYLRRALAAGLGGEYGFLSGIVQGYTCDAACGMVNVWRDNTGIGFSHLVPLPYNDSPESRSFIRSALLELAGVLEAAGANYSDASLQESILLYEKIRNILARMYELRYRNRLPLTAAEFLTVILAGDALTPEEYLVVLETLELGVDAEDAPPPPGIPVIISGSLIEDTGALDAVLEAGGAVVADDLCTGYRGLHPPAGEGSDPMERLADRYMRRLPCPARVRAAERAPLLKDIAAKSGARGVIFLLQKFCTPHLADFPILSKELEGAGLRSILVEMEESGAVGAQGKNRIESFIEMLEGAYGR